MQKEIKIPLRELTLANDMSYPSDQELIMLILGSGTKKMPIEYMAKKIFDVVIKSNSDQLLKNLMEIDGVGKNKALAVAAALELGRRLNRNPQAVLKQPKDVIPYIQNYAIQPMEHFICVSLNGAKEIISIRVICSGSGNMAIMRPGEIFAEAMKEHASAVVVSINHPGGNPYPSNDDIQTTRRIYTAAQVLGIVLLDHIIISRNSYYSFLENKWFERFDKDME